MSAPVAVEEVHIGPNPGPQTEYVRSAADITIFGGSAGPGKALALDTPIATPTGWSTMGDLQVGDLVFAPDGQPTRIVTCSEVQLGRECFDVEFGDETVITADADHLWWTFTSEEWAERSLSSTNQNQQGGVRTTREVASSIAVGKYLTVPGVPFVPRSPLAEFVTTAAGQTSFWFEYHRYIIGVNPRASVPVKCIGVEHPSHCYLAGRDMVPTHNSWGTLFRMGVHADRYPGYYGVIFRRESTQITGGGGLWEESLKLYPMWNARPRGGGVLDWRWPNRSLVEMRHLQHAGDEIAHHGKQYAEVAFDELPTFLEQQFWYLFSRLRSTCGYRSKMIATANPDSESWVRKLVDWWIGDDGLARPDRANKKRYFMRDGDALVWGDTREECRAAAPHVLMDPLSMRFIPAKLSDNPKGDPAYEGKLRAMPLVERERLLGGNWNVRHGAGTVFHRDWFDAIDYVPNDVMQTSRGWDLAATEPHQGNKDPDWTRGVKISRHRSGLFLVQNVKSKRARSLDIDRLLLETAHEDGRSVRQCFWQDPGSAGKAEADRIRRLLAGFDVHIIPAAENKVTYARAASSQAEGGNMKLFKAPWNEEYRSEHHSFPDGAHDDTVDAESRAMIDLTSNPQMRYVHIPGA